jgi:hypothetical protein
MPERLGPQRTLYLMEQASAGRSLQEIHRRSLHGCADARAVSQVIAIKLGAMNTWTGSSSYERQGVGSASTRDVPQSLMRHVDHSTG